MLVLKRARLTYYNDHHHYHHYHHRHDHHYDHHQMAFKGASKIALLQWSLSNSLWKGDIKLSWMRMTNDKTMIGCHVHWENWFQVSRAGRRGEAAVPASDGKKNHLACPICRYLGHCHRVFWFIGLLVKFGRIWSYHLMTIITRWR